MTLRHYRFYLGSKKSEWFSKCWTPWAPSFLTSASKSTPPSGLSIPSSLLCPPSYDRSMAPKVTSGEHKMYLFTDASRFNGAQLNYHVTDKEFLAVVSACRAFEQHLIGYPFVIVTDHQALRTIKTQNCAKRLGTSACVSNSAVSTSNFEFIAGKNTPGRFVVASVGGQAGFTRGSGTSLALHHLPDRLPLLILPSGPNTTICEAGSPGYYALKEESQDEDVNGQELGNLFLKEECHEFITPGESLLEERPYTSPSHDRLPPVDCAFGPGVTVTTQALPGSPHLAENIMDAVDWSIGRLSPPIAVNRVHAIATAPANDPPISGRCRRRRTRFVGKLPPMMSTTPPVVHRPPDPLPQPFLDTVIRAYANDSQAQMSLFPCFVPRGLATGVVNSDKVPSLRELVLSEIHRSVGHAGHRITLAAIRPLYWWSSMSADCAEFCRSCEDCTRGKASTQVPYGRLHPMPIPSGPWEQVAIDFMTGLPPVELEGMMVAQIMVVTDTWGKMVHLIPLPADADSELVAEKYYATVFRLHGMPSAIAKIGTVLRMSTAAHPETDGSSENRIKMVTQTLRIMVSSNHEAWASRLVEAEFALNSSVAVSTSLSAFEATYGYLPRCWPSDSWSVSDVPRAEAFARIRQLRNLDVTDAIIGARLNQSHQANKHRRPDDPAFRTGSYVYLSTKNLAVPDGMKSKLLPRYIGPFRIRAAIPATSSYDLELPPAMSRVHNRFHARLLRPCVENDAERFPGRDPAVLFVEDVADAADNSAIPERIVRDRRNARGARSFLVRWVGRNDTDDTWMSEQSIRLDHPSVLDAYLARLDRSNRRLAAR
ncbi:BZ3500_MvSof-1268-A1-R1_C066g00325 [Microbotryum saponariae]|uniref:BZ3500_MvSof-1268-A1-R1_C066g00325 protein n=1 Tax=Microbotryum saponariae TaxID=289078 RepID=A0A2X0KH93_9BASI|nr:BZ3500_MvSof-1268-A1-R1_C066g00325 [Microbotryum saponariae]